MLPIYVADRSFWNDLVTAAVALTPSSLYLWFTGSYSIVYALHLRWLCQ